jgi:hypothetical protein
LWKATYCFVYFLIAAACNYAEDQENLIRRGSSLGVASLPEEFLREAGHTQTRGAATSRVALFTFVMVMAAILESKMDYLSLWGLGLQGGTITMAKVNNATTLYLSYSWRASFGGNPR